MRRIRRGIGPLDRKLLENALRNVHLRNMTINYSLNHEWEQLNLEIWVCLTVISLSQASLTTCFSRR